MGDSETRFPTVTGQNLEAEELRLPADFEGELNLVLLAFERRQRPMVETWLPFAADLDGRFGCFEYYELPTIARWYSPVRGVVARRMRAGIPDRETRQRTVTLYLDTRSFRDELDLPTDETVYALLVDAVGEVVWQAPGPLTEEKARDVERIVAETAVV